MNINVHVQNGFNQVPSFLLDPMLKNVLNLTFIPVFLALYT
jgi:hypothetical protein